MQLNIKLTTLYVVYYSNIYFCQLFFGNNLNTPCRVKSVFSKMHRPIWICQCRNQYWIRSSTLS